MMSSTTPKLMVPNQMIANMREEGFINVPVIDIEFVMPSLENLGHVSHIIFHTFHTANIFHKICVKLVPIDPLQS